MASANSISCEIATNLRTDILKQRFLSGERLPSERDLASRFDASRGAVREALSQLEQSGLIEIQPGGARVKPIEAASIAIQTMREHESNFDLIIACCFSAADATVYETGLSHKSPASFI